MRPKTVTAALAALALGLAVAACSAPVPPRGEATAQTGSVCARPQGRTPKQTPTTIDVVEQAYFCILGNYYSGSKLDARVLLTAGFAALTRELDRGGRDVAESTMPALTGDRKADWNAFEAAFRKIAGKVPDLDEKLAVVTLEAMVAGLGDDHAAWQHDPSPTHPDLYDGDRYGLGLSASVSPLQLNGDPENTLPPLFVTAVLGGAAQKAGVRPGDLIESIDGSAPFIDGKLTSAAVAALYPRYPDEDPVRLRLLRESTGRRWSVTLKPDLFQPDLAALQLVRTKLLRDSVAYVQIAAFGPQVADRALKAVARLGTLTGIVLDLRGNTGGSPDEVNRLLGAFAHNKITAYQCSVDGKCTAMRTDNGVTLLNLPLAVLTDRGCASACEHFSAAVKDLRLGQLVGTRTAGAVSGLQQPYLLMNNSILGFPSKHHLGPNREQIDKVGVSPDHYLPLTAGDVAAGRDPALSKALSLLPT
ncbi:S41 family peptidase [Nonomuraea insulae]|uniref:S41 family peptidase n=1 Tax=Nonomuraea insulae TaxID=1616787 RepID=A0ABW1DBC8_9ACTN